ATDRYGRAIPKHAHGTANLGLHTSSSEILLRAISELYDRIVNKSLSIRRLSLCANHLLDEATVTNGETMEQLDLFTDYAANQRDKASRARERKIQETMLDIKHRFGKNAILKGMNLEEGATAKERNQTIGGHQA